MRTVSVGGRILSFFVVLALFGLGATAAKAGPLEDAKKAACGRDLLSYIKATDTYREVNRLSATQALPANFPTYNPRPSDCPQQAEVNRPPVLPQGFSWVGPPGTQAPVTPPPQRFDWSPQRFDWSPNLGSSLGSLILEIGGLDVGDATHSASCNACTTRPGQSAGSSATFVGVDFRINLAGLISVIPRTPVRFTENFYMTGPFMGFRVRRYFDQSGQEVGYDLHVPTAGIDSFLSYQAAWAYKTYIGMQFMWLNPLASLQIAAIGIAPYVGIAYERGRTQLRSDESGGGGVANVFEKTESRSGTAVGVDFDLFFQNLPFFVGLGLQWDMMPEITLSGLSLVNNFSYQGRVAERTSFTANARIGIPLGGGMPMPANSRR